MQAKLDHVEQLTPDIASFWFKPDRPMRYVAGQFIEITLPHNLPDNRGVKRWFTISSAPGHELISITTKHDPQASSSFKKHLWLLKPGQTITISEPMGDFVLPKDVSQQLVFVAGGIGITPFHSIVQWLIDTNQTRLITLIYSVSSAQEVIFRDTFRQPFIKVIERISQLKLTANEVIKLADGIDNKQIFISGPEPMTEALVEQFKPLGITQEQLITDYFPGYPA